MTDARLDPNHADYSGVQRLPPVKYVVASPIAAMRQKCDKNSMQTSELLYGEAVTIHGEAEDYYLIQCEHDGYVGFCLKNNFCTEEIFGTRGGQIIIPHAPLFSKPELKSRIYSQLSGNSFIPTHEKNAGYYKIMVHLHGRPTSAYIHKNHVGRLEPLSLTKDSLINTARQYLGLPYIWGGRSFRGLDCSGLIQQVLGRHGVSCSRDSDMDYPDCPPLPADTELQKADIVFWKGHVGIFTGENLIHAYGATCLVQEDNAKEIFPLLKAATNHGITAIRRLI